MSRSAKQEAPETLGERIDLLVKATGGTMQITMSVKTEAEATAARELLKTKRGAAAKLIDVKVRPDMAVANCECADDFVCTSECCPRKGKAYSNHISDAPLNGLRTHPLKSASLAALRRLRAGPLTRQEFNPGVADRLLRSAYVESYRGPSPYATRLGEREYLKITPAGLGVVEELGV